MSFKANGIKLLTLASVFSLSQLFSSCSTQKETCSAYKQTTQSDNTSANSKCFFKNTNDDVKVVHGKAAKKPNPVYKAAAKKHHKDQIKHRRSVVRQNKGQSIWSKMWNGSRDWSRR